jgi:small subunit ribosomal protein S7
MALSDQNKFMLNPDTKYNNIIIAKFINYIMECGKKILAQNTVYKAFDKIEELEKKDPLLVFQAALANTTPRLETKPKRVGGATYQVPFEVTEKRGNFLAMKWILEQAKKKKGKPMYSKLAEEIIMASKSEGAAVKKKTDTERMAEANKAFAHLVR